MIYKFLESDCRGVFNVGTGVGTNVKQLVNKILKAFNLKKNPDVEFLNKGTKSSLILDISKTSSLFGWQPKYQLERGLKKFVI